MTLFKYSSHLKKHVWAEWLKHVFIITLSYMAVIFLLAIPESTENFRRLLQINFTSINYSGLLISKPLFYILYEELAFRSSLKDSKVVLVLASAFLLILSIYQFSRADYSFYLFSIYGLFLLIHLNRQAQSRTSLFMNYILGLLGLCSFHLLKFDLSIIPINTVLTNYLFPILLLGIFLNYLKNRYNRIASLLCYLLIYLISQRF